MFSLHDRMLEDQEEEEAEEREREEEGDEKMMGVNKMEQEQVLDFVYH